MAKLQSPLMVRQRPPESVKVKFATWKSAVRVSGSRKVKAKTVTRLLTPEQAADYQGYLDNDRRLRALLHELETLTLEIVEADPVGAPEPASGARTTLSVNCPA